MDGLTPPTPPLVCPVPRASHDARAVVVRAEHAGPVEDVVDEVRLAGEPGHAVKVAARVRRERGGRGADPGHRGPVARGQRAEERAEHGVGGAGVPRVRVPVPRVLKEAPGALGADAAQDRVQDRVAVAGGFEGGQVGGRSGAGRRQVGGRSEAGRRQVGSAQHFSTSPCGPKIQCCSKIQPHIKPVRSGGACIRVENGHLRSGHARCDDLADGAAAAHLDRNGHRARPVLAADRVLETLLKMAVPLALELTVGVWLFTKR
jgi:hypothetical protein